jgi:hypothetical protein
VKIAASTACLLSLMLTPAPAQETRGVPAVQEIALPISLGYPHDVRAPRPVEELSDAVSSPFSFSPEALSLPEEEPSYSIGPAPGFTRLLVAHVWEHAQAGMTWTPYFAAVIANLDWDTIESRRD